MKCGVPLCILVLVLSSCGRAEHSVEDFGAIPNDGEPDTAAFQAAVDAVALDGGGRLNIGPGQFDVGQVTLPSKIILQGEGSATVIKKLPASGRHMFIATNREHLTFLDIHFDGNEANQSLGDYTSTIRTTGCKYVTAQRCFWTAGGDRAVDLRNTSNVILVANRGIGNGINNPDGNGGATLHVDRIGNERSGRSSEVIAVANILEHGGDSLIGMPSTLRGVAALNILRGAEAVGETPSSTESGLSLVSNEFTSVSGNVFDRVNIAINYRDRTHGGNPYPVVGVGIVGNVGDKARFSANWNRPETTGAVVGHNVLHDGRLNFSGDTGKNLLVDGNLLMHESFPRNGIEASSEGPKQYSFTANVFDGYRFGIELQKFVDPLGVVHGNMGFNCDFSVNPQNGVLLFEELEDTTLRTMNNNYKVPQ